MAVSIVSNPFGDDNQTSTNTILSQDGSVSSSVAQDTFVEENTSPINAVPNQIIQTQDIAVTANDDGQRLNDLHPEEATSSIQEEVKTVEEKGETIPNMYIKADIENTPSDVPAEVAIFSEESKQEDAGGFDMEDLINEETSPATTEQVIATPVAQESIQASKTAAAPTASTDPLVQESIKPIDVQQKQKATLPIIAPKKSLTKSLAMVATGLFGVVVIGFVVMTMFPVGIDGSTGQDNYEEEIIAQEPSIEETVEEEIVEEHTAAEEKTPQEIAKGELVNYSTLGEEYYTLGRDLKDRNMVRYALYVEKKAKDLIDMLDLDPNMDTKDIVVYFAQFDDYLKTLADWKAGLGDTLPIPSSDSSIIEEDMFIQPEDTFTDTSTTTADDTNTGSTQSGTSLTEPEQSELSDG